jgi:hypothetical protein
MKKPEPRSEYDFRDGTRGWHVRLAAKADNQRTLDPDLAERFPDSASVNEALRGIASSRPAQRPATTTRRQAKPLPSA